MKKVIQTIGFCPTMEQQEEKKMKVYKRQRRRSKSSSSSLPIDLISEILLRLPKKSVVRFRCVSKSWSSITTDPYFKTRSPRLLLCFKANEMFFVSSIPQHRQTFVTSNKTYSSSQPIDGYSMEFPIYDFFPPTESVQGFICLQIQKLATPIVWNPSTRRFLTLPKPCRSWYALTIFLGYDPVESKLKVMCIPFSRGSHECRVLTLGSAQESWRTVKISHYHCSDYHTSGRCIKGVVYYLAYEYHMEVWCLMSFDVRSEKFDKIQLPPSDIHKDILIPYQGKLACVDRKPNMMNGLRLWILEDAEKHKWSSKDFLKPPLDHEDKSLGAYLLLKGFTQAGEFVYVEHTLHKSSYILFWDPLRNIFKRFKVDGHTLHVFPNHVESLVSL